MQWNIGSVQRKTLLGDNSSAWELDADAKWTRREGGTRAAQRELAERALDRAAPEDLRQDENERDGGVPSAR